MSETNTPEESSSEERSTEQPGVEIPRPGGFQVDADTRRRNRITALIITILVLTMILVGTRHQLFGP